MSDAACATNAGDLETPAFDALYMARVLASLLEGEFEGVEPDDGWHRVGTKSADQILWASYHTIELIKHLQGQVMTLIAAGAKGGLGDGAS